MGVKFIEGVKDRQRLRGSEMLLVSLETLVFNLAKRKRKKRSKLVLKQLIDVLLALADMVTVGNRTELTLKKKNVKMGSKALIVTSNTRGFKPNASLLGQMGAIAPTSPTG